MIKISTNPDQNIFHATLDGGISADDIETMKSALDGYINEQDKVPSLVIEALNFPSWDSLATFHKHLNLVKNHHKLVPKIAIVGDGMLIDAVPALLDYFVQAKMRHFSKDKLAEALLWAAHEGSDGPAFTLLKGFPRDVIAIDAHGTITAKDYETILMPLVTEKMKEHDKLKMFFRISDDADWNAGAMFDDMRFGLGNVTTFSKIALVTDIGWIRKSANLFGPLWPAKIMAFNLDDELTAEQWIRS